MESALSLPIQLVYRHSTQIILKLKMQIEDNRIENPTGMRRGGNQLAIYTERGRGFELGTTENKSSKWPERDSNPGSASDALTTRPCCLPKEWQVYDLMNARPFESPTKRTIW